MRSTKIMTWKKFQKGIIRKYKKNVKSHLISETKWIQTRFLKNQQKRSNSQLITALTYS